MVCVRVRVCACAWTYFFQADNWLIDRAIEVGRVAVVDATAAVTVFHLPHNYSHLRFSAANPTPPMPRSKKRGSKGNFWSLLRRGQGDDAVLQYTVLLRK